MKPRVEKFRTLKPSSTQDAMQEEMGKVRRKYVRRQVKQKVAIPLEGDTLVLLVKLSSGKFVSELKIGLPANDTDMQSFVEKWMQLLQSGLAVGANSLDASWERPEQKALRLLKEAVRVQYGTYEETMPGLPKQDVAAVSLYLDGTLVATSHANSTVGEAIRAFDQLVKAEAGN